MSKILQKEIRKILQDTENLLQPNDVIEEKDPFFWRISKKWAKEKATRIMELINKIK